MYKWKKHLMPKQIKDFINEHCVNINLEHNTHPMSNLDFHMFCAYFNLSANTTSSWNSLRTEFYLWRTIHYVYTLLKNKNYTGEEDWEMEAQKDYIILQSEKASLE